MHRCDNFFHRRKNNGLNFFYFLFMLSNIFIKFFNFDFILFRIFIFFFNFFNFFFFFFDFLLNIGNFIWKFITRVLELFFYDIVNLFIKFFIGKFYDVIEVKILEELDKDFFIFFEFFVIWVEMVEQFSWHLFIIGLFNISKNIA
jgi:hypothetical protein